MSRYGGHGCDSCVRMLTGAADAMSSIADVCCFVTGTFAVFTRTVGYEVVTCKHHSAFIFIIIAKYYLRMNFL